MLFALIALLIGAIAAADAAHAAPNVQFGMEQNGGMEALATRTDLLDRQQDLGASVIRLLLRWDRVATCNPGAQAASPTAQCYDFSVPDAVVAGAHARGMEVIFSVYGVPSWRTVDGRENYTGGSDAEFNAVAASYADFVEAATRRYDGRSGHPRVSQWTIWNEPNGQFWLPLRTDAGELIGAHRYARLYDLAARRIKQVDASLSVAPGPTAPMAAKNSPPIQWATAVLADLQALGSPIDAWAHNGYMGTMSPFHHNVRSPYVGLGNVTDLTRVMDRYSVARGKPIWITEFGYQTKPSFQPGVEPAEQATLLADAMRYAWSHPRITSFIWYSVIDDDIRVMPMGFQSGLYFADDTCGSKVCPKPSAAMFRHPVWVSAQRSGKVTLWGRGARDGARTRIFVKHPASGWRAYANTNTARTGAVTVTLPVIDGMVVMTCDVVCGPQRTIAKQRVASARKLLAPVRLSKRSALARGVAFKIPCRGCTVSATIQTTGRLTKVFNHRARTVVVAKGSVRSVAGGRRVTLRFTPSARRKLAAQRGPVKLVVRSVVTATDGSTIIYDRTLTLR